MRRDTDELLLCFLGTLEALAGKKAEITCDPGDGHLQWAFVGDSPEGKMFAPMIFIDWDQDLVSFHWCACDIDDGDATLDERISVCLGRIPLPLGQTLRKFKKNQESL